MKKFSAAAILSILILAFAAFPAFGAEAVWRVLHDGAVFYADPELQTELRTLPRNAAVELLNEVDGVAEAVYMGETGYILASNLYRTAETIYEGEEEKKITASVLGEKIPLRKFPYDDSPVLKELKDGEKVSVKLGGVVYTGYSEVVSDGTVGFVRNESLTTGLTLNGAIALTVGVVTGVLVILILILLGYSKRVKNEKRRREAQLIEEAREYDEQP